MTQFKIWKFQTNMFHDHVIYISSADFQLLISHSASFYVQYQNTNHIPAAAIISVNQHQLMYLTALFQIQMKHLCERQLLSALVLIDGGFAKMMQLVITSHHKPQIHNSA